MTDKNFRNKITFPREINRRDLLKLLAGWAALAQGISGCRRKPPRKVVSRVDDPEFLVPGKNLYYSTTWTEGCYPYGMVAKTIDGRPIKLEGNENHPTNAGSSSAAMQASLFSLYDPDRLREPFKNEKAISWQKVDQDIITQLSKASSVLLLTGSCIGPSRRKLYENFLKVCPNSQHMVFEPVNDYPRRSTWKRIVGHDGEIKPHFEKAGIILSIESDFLGTDGPVLENTRKLNQSRTIDENLSGQIHYSRLYVVEGMMSLTGSNADYRIPMKSSLMIDLVKALLNYIRGNDRPLHQLIESNGLRKEDILALVNDLSKNRGKVLVVAGSHLPESLHALVLLLNQALDAFDKTLTWNPFPPTLPSTDFKEIKSVLNNGVEIVLFMNVNPMYFWPNKGVEDFLKKSRLTVGHGLYMDETMAQCHYALPSHHFLESWDDSQIDGGTFSITQPVISPVWNSRCDAESILIWTQGLVKNNAQSPLKGSWYEYVRKHWETAILPGTFNHLPTWNKTLAKGVALKQTEIAFPAIARDIAEKIIEEKALSNNKGKFELKILPHPGIWDGRFANNAWLQELPDPINKLVWDSAVSMSPNTARNLHVVEGNIIEIKLTDESIYMPVLIQQGMADEVLVTTLGHGRSQGGRILRNTGFSCANALASDTGITDRLVYGIKIESTSKRYALVRAQKRFSMENRPIVLESDFPSWNKNREVIQKMRHKPHKNVLYHGHKTSRDYKWSMAIDLHRCTGCSACVVACQAENNIPIVGKEQIFKGREMHWLRIDTYYEGRGDNPSIHHQPLFCQQCDNAPCESVCPSAATTHHNEGLNEMVYNRCVGTRYCSNNCPYKVRRFNYFNYQKRQLRAPVQELVFNPHVTVRTVGVMEKCTFCIQRINEKKYRAKNRDKKVSDGQIVPACAQACPAKAIVFGNILDKRSVISRVKSSKRIFFLLEELNIKPNIAYLARIRNTLSSKKQPSTGNHQVS